jgi:hypothetical protein
MALPFAILAMLSLTIFLSTGNLSLILLYTLLPVHMIHEYEEHSHGRFVEFFKSATAAPRRRLVREGYHCSTEAHRTPLAEQALWCCQP